MSAISSSVANFPLLLRRSSSRTIRVRAMATESVVPAVIVGGGRVGRALQAMGGGRDLLVGRGQPVPADFDGPVFVCTRNDDLEAVLEATPASRWTDLVFFQNGMLEPWLQSKGLDDANQVLAYFAVSKLGEPPIDGKTDTNPEGLTASYGKWAAAVASRLQNGGLSCKVLEKEAFQKQMFEKLIWISAFMLVGARHPGATVGVVEKDYRYEASGKPHRRTSGGNSCREGNIFRGGHGRQAMCLFPGRCSLPNCCKRGNSNGGMAGFIRLRRRQF
ncbi:hypothetical protein M6B38_186550 [Iris pallida]|uniref:Uncharacterized protein n=1 Tax=Iris pallida TaxID=29817 RepID=A0AAX6EJ85_IRIPA|nr:hypothetical protein M6B38_186550 [Iris pallida]